MNPPNEAPSTDSGKHDSFSIGDTTLDRYAGQYQLGDWYVLAVSRHGSTLFVDMPAREHIELRPTGECDFELIDVAGQTVTFDKKADGTVSALRLRMSGGEGVAVRIDSQAAEHVRARLAARIKDQKPLQGSNAAVRRLVEGLISGHPNYDEMLPVLAHAAKQQLYQLHTTAAFLGPIKSIDFQGVGSQGYDVYDVLQERGTSRVRIMQRSDGLIASALFSVKDSPVSLGP